MTEIARCTRRHLPIWAAVCTALLLVGKSAQAEAGYAEGDAEVCLDCHDETDDYPVYSIFKSHHGTPGDPRSPMGQEHTCQTCHGPSAEHVEDSVVDAAVQFGTDAPPGPQNEACLGCHRGGMQNYWDGGVHDSAGVACSSCHKIHTGDDPVMAKNIRPDVLVRGNQAEVCFSCHKQERAQMHRPSAHPIRDGKMDCSDCHNPHSSATPGQLLGATLNETCYRCHAEKRGPFLYEHAPVREDCTLCHTPHGSNHPKLLATRTYLLCQECHSSVFHPSAAYGPELTNGSPDYHIVQRSCMNCHTEVHGSNHPSGPRWTR